MDEEGEEMSEFDREELKTNKIYKVILSEVHNLVKDVNKETKNKKLSIANNATKLVLNEIEDDIKQEYKELKKNAEWKNFTIAFYGETNAGKSTIIETLRIILKEKTKVEEGKKLKRIERENISDDEKKHLAKDYLDGAIIGDGKSDYTQKNKTYIFYNGNCKYKMIDVPGIEGEESQVVREITDAVQKAHVVFFVTRKETPPQVNDSDGGILGKIKKHLGRQTEVWTIFNKSVTNVNTFKKMKSEEEVKNNLEELHRAIKAQLGDQYRGEIILSALPAFLSVAENLDKDSRNYRKKEKFLQEYNREEILERTGFREFNRMLKEDIISDVERKIVISNQRKAMHVLKITCEKIGRIKKDYEGMQAAFKSNYEGSSDKLMREFAKWKQNVDIRNEEIVRETLDFIRNDSYEKIEDDIKNSEYKKMLKDNIRQGMSKLKLNLESMYNEEIINLKSRIDEIINDAMHNYGKLINAREVEGEKFKFNNNFDDLIKDIMEEINDGIKWKRFFVGILNLAIAAMLAGGMALWKVIGGLVVVAIDTFIAFFSSSYRRKQQKKGVEKLIEKIRDNIKAKTNEISSQIKEDIEQKSKLVEEVLREPYDEIGLHVNSFEKVVSRLERIQTMEEI